ncbi:hypothetical protein [Streptomyces macrosporus]|uniref:Uncharacterized protein n=1 Tax=Streptomyces macrosporus TaxID=44032 RepID=A0ABP5WZK2_9ACTN
MTTPSETVRLLATADRLLASASSPSSGTWRRGACFALRSALEKRIDQYHTRRYPAAARCSMRAKFICLTVYADREAARAAMAVWHALSMACHYHHYELPPTFDQLRHWRAEVRRALTLLDRSDD